LCENQLEMIPTYHEQAARWRRASPSRAQRTALSLLDADIDDFETVVRSTLALAKEMASSTIDAILRMDDGELETAVFEERKPPPSGPPLNEAFRVREYRSIAAMLDAVGATAPPRAHPLEFLAAVAPQLPLFHRLMELCNKNEMNRLCAEYPRLYRFAKTMERVAAGIRSGAIPVGGLRQNPRKFRHHDIESINRLVAWGVTRAKSLPHLSGAGFHHRADKIVRTITRAAVR